MIHDLKITPVFFHQQQLGLKPFEIRFNDRDFKTGDQLLLNEFDPVGQIYTGRSLLVEVTFLTSFMQKDGYVVMATKLI